MTPPRYQPFYCEENVFHLCADGRLAGRSPRAVFVCNAGASVLVWSQRAAEDAAAPIVWDYHAIVIAAAGGGEQRGYEAWDLDSTLGCPVPAPDYLAATFRAGVPDRFAPRFRVVDADELLATFASDRAHMLAPGGGYQRPPPPWPPVGAAGAASNLRRFLDVTDPFVGEILDLAAMVRRFGGRAA